MNGKQLKNSILQLAIQGKLVPQDPHDEPASVLLQRIRKEKEQLVKEGKLKKKDLESEPVTEEEKPFDIPDTWKWVRISEISTVVRGGSPRPAGSLEFYEGSIPFMCVADITKDESMYVNSASKSIKEAGLKKTRMVEPNTLLLSNSGATLGVPKINTFSTTFNDGIAAFLYLNDDIKPFVYWFFKSQTDILRNIDQGTAQPNLNTDLIKSICMPLPPLSEQALIIRKIEELMPLVEEYDKAQTKLDILNAKLPEALRKSILQEAIQGKLVPQDPHDEPASVLLQRIRKEKEQLVKDGKLKKKDLDINPISDEEIPYDIPENWRWVRFEDIAMGITGKTPERGNSNYWASPKYPWVSISDMNDWSHLTTTKEGISEKAASIMRDISSKGSLIMSFKLTVGRTSILDIDAYHNEAIITVKPFADKDNYLRDYLFTFLPLITQSGDSKDAIKGRTLNAKSIAALLIPLPPLEEMHRIVDKLSKVLPKIDSGKFQL